MRRGLGTAWFDEARFDEGERLTWLRVNLTRLGGKPAWLGGRHVRATGAIGRK